MKLQIQGQSLRFRSDEAELTQLFESGCLENRLCLPDGSELRQTLTLAAQDTASFAASASHWQVTLPRAVLAAYRERLPSREGVQFLLPSLTEGQAPLRLIFEVDVRDSVRLRHGHDRRGSG